jgi:hypothetical protein
MFCCNSNFIYCEFVDFYQLIKTTFSLPLFKLVIMRKIIPYLLLVFSISACTANKYVYSPISSNGLLLDSAKDLKAAINYAAAGNINTTSQRQVSNGLDIQTAYAINNKIGIKLDGSLKQESNEFNYNNNSTTNTQKDEIKYKKAGVEVSLGFYNSNKKNQKSGLQVFGGVGMGKLELKGMYSATPSTIFFHTMNYSKIFIQANPTLWSSKNYSFTFITKLSVIKYYNIQTNYTDLDKEPLGYIGSKPSVFGDIAFQNEFGFNPLKGIKFQTQLGLTKLFSRFPLSTNRTFNTGKYDYNNAWFNIGAIANIRQLFF